MWWLILIAVMVIMAYLFVLGLCRLAGEATRMEERFLEYNQGLDTDKDDSND